MEFLRNFNKITKKDVAIAGGKAASLGEMTQAGIPVPPGFVILANAFEFFLDQANLNIQIDAILDSLKHKQMASVEKASQTIQNLILKAELSQNIITEIQKCFATLNSKYVAVRSSATAEDAANAAWAGQLETYLNTTEGNLVENVKKCWASLFTPRAIFYRFEKGLNKHKISVAVVVQKMVQSEKSGIAFSVHPISEDKNQLIIEAVLGLGEAIVSGQITPDSYIVTKQPLQITVKNIQSQSKAVLSDAEILQLTKIILDIEKHYNFPCDIEWALEKGNFYIVQSRPITSLSDYVPSLIPPFELLIQDFNVTPFVIHNLGDVMANDLKEFLSDPPRCLFQFTEHNVNWYAEIPKWEVTAQEVVQKLCDNPDSYVDFTNALESDIANLMSLSTGLHKKDFSVYSLTELTGIYFEMLELYKKVYTRGMIATIADLHKPYLTNGLTELLKNYTNDAAGTFVKLTTPERMSHIAQEEYDLLKLAADNKVIENSLALEKHEHLYFWLTFGYEGPPYTISDIWSKIKVWRLKSDALVLKIKEYEDRRSLVIGDIKKVSQELKLPVKIQKIFSIARNWLYLKEARKAAFFAVYAVMDKIATEIAKYKNVSKNHIKFLTSKELQKVLYDSVFPDNFEARFENMVLAYEDGKELVLAGLEAQAYLASQVKPNVNVKTEKIHGQIAYKGKVQGIVKIIRTPADMSKVKDGDILVSPATNPNLLPAMHKAAAFVTDVGGITCHAAIVAREMKKPCIVGTKVATQLLKDGDLVEVDANIGVLRILKIA